MTRHLSHDEIHVWRARLREWPGASSEARILSSDEQARAARYRLAATRRRYVAARIFLRTLIASYLDIGAEDVRFAYGAYGKPALDRLHESDISFNLSHSGDIAMCALGRGTDIGVDIEQRQPFPDAATVVERFFSPREQAIFRAVPPHERSLAFLLGWTRKEAYVKGCGTGFNSSMAAVEVTLAPGSVPSILRGAPGSGAWWLADVGSDEVSVAALAVRGGHRRVVLAEWPDGTGAGPVSTTDGRDAAKHA